MSQFFPSGGQSIGGSASALVLAKNIQEWFPLGWTGSVSLHFKGLSRVLSNTTVQKHKFFGIQLSLWSDSHIHPRLLEKAISLTIQRFTGKGMSLLFSMLSRFFIVLFQGASVFFSTAAVTICSDFGSQENKVCHCFHCFSMYLHEVMELNAIILVFWSVPTTSKSSTRI